MAPPNFDRWIDREPRLSYLISTMRRVGCTDMQVMSTMAALAFILEDGKGPLAVTSAELAAAITPAPAPAAPAPAPAPAASKPAPAPKPTSTFSLMSPAKAEPPKRQPFERALQTVCPPTPGISRPWSLPESRKDAAQAADSGTRKWDKVLRTVCSTGLWSMPDERAR
jgi:hypothetical protein